MRLVMCLGVARGIGFREEGEVVSYGWGLGRDDIPVL